MKTTIAPSSVVLDAHGQPAWVTALRNNWYEGSRWSPNRSWIWHPPQDAKKDLDRYTRRELIKHSRYLWKNSPLIRGVIERLVTLTVGAGIYPVFKSSDPKWNERAAARYKRKSKNVNLGPRCSMSQYQRIAARARFLDGEGFTVKTFDNEVTYEARLQGIESERVNGASKKDQAEVAVVPGPVDGFNLNGNGTVVSYNFQDVDTPYDAADVIHHFTPGRFGQYRGEPILASAINTARDIDDILALEKQCVKEASGRKDIIKTASGQMDAEQYRMIRYNQGNFNTPFALPEDTGDAKNDYYNVIFGAQSVVLKRGDEYTPYVPNRPGNAWMGFMEFLSGTTCMSTGMPISVMMPANIGGTDLRKDLDVAQKVVEPWQLDLALEFDEIVEYLMMDDFLEGELSKGRPADYQLRDWQFPAKLNVDRAQAQQDREDVAVGLMTIEEYHGRWSQDGARVESTVVAEMKRRKANIKEAGFKDVDEFVKYLSLNPMLFASKTEPKPKEKTAA